MATALDTATSEPVSIDTSSQPHRRKVWWFTILSVALVALCCGISLGQYSTKRSQNWLIPFWNVQLTAPVVCEIVFRPEIKYPEGTNQVAVFSGPAEFIFTNYSDKPVKMAFPPIRSFNFSATSFSHDATLPEFAQEQKTYELAAGDSIRFEADHGATVIGNDPQSYLKGGPGYIGFVFSRPADAAADDNYLVGTILPWCSTYAQDGSTDDEAMKRAADFNFATTKYSTVFKKERDGR
ncbi:MAG: hypothetical protein WEB58_08700 [Planctomycetaceae bacterium]